MTTSTEKRTGPTSPAWTPTFKRISSMSPRAFMSEATPAASAAGKPAQRAATQHAPPLPRSATKRTKAKSQSADGEMSRSRRVCRPEKAKKNGNSHMAIPGSMRRRPRVSSPRGNANPQRKPPKTACIPHQVLSATNAAKSAATATTAVGVNAFRRSHSAESPAMRRGTR